MKIPALLAILATTIVLASPAQATPDADAAQKLAKDSGCMKCHGIDKSKKGPSFQKTSAKYKGKTAEGEGKLRDLITKTTKVKLDDGSEEEHGAVKSKDDAQIKNLVSWILAQ